LSKEYIVYQRYKKYIKYKKDIHHFVPSNHITICGGKSNSTEYEQLRLVATGNRFVLDVLKELDWEMAGISHFGQ